MCGIAVKRKVWHMCGMSREDLHFRLRIPEDLKKRIEESAAENRRSMTAEIVERLEESFKNRANGQPEPIAVIEVILDTNGLPISWGEIHEHLSAINHAGGFNVVSQNASIFTPKMIGSGERRKEAAELARKYRTKGYLK
jgi:hypothetical protein